MSWFARVPACFQTAVTSLMRATNVVLATVLLPRHAILTTVDLRWTQTLIEPAALLHDQLENGHLA